MKIDSLKLKNFRNHEELEIEFNGKSAIISGPNGIGKTNILEAIHLLSTTKSLRTKYDRELINHNANVAHVEALIHPNGNVETLEMTIAKNPNFENASKKIVKLNKVNKSLSSFTGTLNSVLFAPTDLEILTGSPTLRREYVDSVLFQIDREYKRSHGLYIKAVRQRNKVLEQIAEEKKGRDQLPYWSEQIINLGQLLQKRREDLLDYFRGRMDAYSTQLGADENSYQIKYVKNEISEERLKQYETKELFTRKTLIGPHRDDFEIIYLDFNIATFGSRGQQRTTVLALKLCEIDYLTEQTSKRPVLLLDDIFSELDPLHRKSVENIMELQQTIVTTAIDATNDITVRPI